MGEGMQLPEQVAEGLGGQLSGNFRGGTCFNFRSAVSDFITISLLTISLSIVAGSAMGEALEAEALEAAVL
jgi:hypothetical protein